MRIIIYLAIIFFMLSCKTHSDTNPDTDSGSSPSLIGKSLNCVDLSEHFNSYEEAKEAIHQANFRISEKVNTDGSSWIRGAQYYSCDGHIGFFILETDKKDYLFKDLPVDMWNEFKNAPSFGKYYHENIKGRFQFYLK
jgi:hypothetical protein